MKKPLRSKFAVLVMALAIGATGVAVAQELFLTSATVGECSAGCSRFNDPGKFGTCLGKCLNA